MDKQTNDAVASNVYQTLVDHQTQTEWDLQATFAELHRWVGIFDSEFELQLPPISLRVDEIGRRALGHYRYGRNGFGLQREIAIARRHLEQSERYRVLGTLLHEMLHAWQDLNGTPGKHGYHNVEFRNKAASFGLFVDAQGRTTYAEPSPFFDLLARHGVRLPSTPATPVAVAANRSHSSKLKLWQCACGVKVRIGRTSFRAKCLECDGLFVLQTA